MGRQGLMRNEIKSLATPQRLGGEGVKELSRCPSGETSMDTCLDTLADTFLAFIETGFQTRNLQDEMRMRQHQ